MTDVVEPKSEAREIAELEKLALEADKLRSDLVDAELQRELRHAEIRQRTAEAVAAEQNALMQSYRQAAMQREEDALNHADSTNYVYHFNDGVDDEIVYDLVDTANSWHRENPESKWHIYIDSPGGYINSGFVLFDQLAAYSERRGGKHEITMTVRGMAASMAAVLLQVADKRVMGKNASLLLHQPSSWLRGNLGNMAHPILEPALPGFSPDPWQRRIIRPWI